MYITLGVLVVSAMFFMSGKVRSDLVALCALLILILSNVLTPEEGLTGFSNSVVIMMIGLFVVSGGIFQTGLAKMISSKILRLAGNSELKLFVLVMLVTSGIGAFISNTGTVALMLPIIVSLCAASGANASRLLMPLAFASSMGGMLTLIGTPPNLIIDSALRDAGYEGLKFFTFAPIGAICITVGLVVLIPLSKKFLSKRGVGDNGNDKKNKSLQDLASEYGLTSNLFRLTVPPVSAVIGKTVKDLDVYRKYSLNVLEIRRFGGNQSRFMKSVSQKLPVETELVSGDVLYVMGEFDAVRSFSEEYSLGLLTTRHSESAGEQKPASSRIDFYDIGIAEIVLLSTSSVINKTVVSSGIRKKYGVNILGIRRRKDYILHDLKDEKLHNGDVLLVQGSWDDIGRLSEDTSEWVVLGQPLEEASKVTLNYKAPVAGGILLMMIAAMMFDFIPVAPVTAVLAAAVLMVISGCVRSVEAAYKLINWESIVLIAAMLPMSLALEKTGVSELIAGALADNLGRFGPIVLLAGIYFTTSLMTIFISNTATAVLLTPIALQAAVTMDASPYPFLFAVSVSASMCFASPFSTPPNALVMPAGQYTFNDFIKVGLPLQIIMGIVMVFALPLLFPF